MMELGLSLGIGRHRKRYCRRNRCVGFKYRFLEFGWFVDLGWILLEASSLDSGCFLSMVLICFSREGGINTNSAEVTLSLDFLFTLPNVFITVILFFQLVIFVENSDRRVVTSVYI